MKNIYILFLSFYCIESSAQSPPQLNLDNIEVEWTVPIVDSNFIKEEFDPYSSKYWGFNFLQLLELEGDLLLLYGSRTQSPYGGVDGCLIHNIDKDTGTTNWIHHNNINSGNDRRSHYNVTSMSKNSNDQLHLTGLTDLDTLRKDFPNFFFRAQPTLRIIDCNTGTLLDKNEGNEDLSSYFNFSVSVLPYTNSNEDVFGITAVQKRENDRNYSTFEFVGIDSGFNFQVPHLSDVRVLLSDTLQGLPKFPSVVSPINKDSILLFYYDPYIEDLSLSPQGLFIQIVDVTSLEDIKVTNEFYIDENIYYPQSQTSGLSIFPQVFDNNIIITQKEYVNIEESLDLFIWLHWYDLQGNLLAFVPIAGGSDPFDLIYPIGLKDGKIYFLGEREDVFVICYLEEGADDVIEVKSFQITNSEFHDTRISNLEFLNDQQSVFMSLKCEYINENGENSHYSYMTLVDNTQLGIVTDTKQLSEDSYNMNIHPNPASEFIRLDSNLDGLIEIYDHTGRIIHNQTYHANDVINVSHLASGVYIVIIKQSNSLLREKLIIVR